MWLIVLHTSLLFSTPVFCFWITCCRSARSQKGVRIDASLQSVSVMLDGQIEIEIQRSAAGIKWNWGTGERYCCSIKEKKRSSKQQVKVCKLVKRKKKKIHDYFKNTNGSFSIVRPLIKCSISTHLNRHCITWDM